VARVDYLGLVARPDLADLQVIRASLDTLGGRGGVDGRDGAVFLGLAGSLGSPARAGSAERAERPARVGILGSRGILAGRVGRDGAVYLEKAGSVGRAGPLDGVVNLDSAVPAESQDILVLVASVVGADGRVGQGLLGIAVRLGSAG